MLLTEYLSGLTKDIDEYARTGFVLSSEVAADTRTEKIGLIKGALVFLDESKLFFIEYLDLRYKIEKLSYSFHYQSKKGELIFRYDNARHKPELKYREHKHMKEAVVQCGSPDLRTVLEEIIGNLLRLK
jgi:hypothetical protein